MKRSALIICMTLLYAGTLGAERFVFDMPEAHALHLQLLAMMNAAHARQDYYGMEAVTHQGIALGTSDNLWTYNLACALALEDNPDEAIGRLQEALELGFDDLEHIQTDPDLRSLHGLDKFTALLEALQKKISDPAYTNTALRKIVALPQGADHNVYQFATNTVWSFSTGLFHTFLSLPPQAATNAPPYRGLQAGLINALRQEPAAETLPAIIYVNRDNDGSLVQIENYPGSVRLRYGAEVKERNLHLGQPNTLFVNENSGRLIPAVGNSSMGFINSSYWRSQPRSFFNDPVRINNQIALLMGNQLYCYPAYSDYSLATGDLFPANTPYYIAVADKAKSEKIFAEALLAAIAAMRSETLDHLTRKGLLMPTIQMLLRKSQREIIDPLDYLTGVAHPTAFQSDQLDTERLVRSARALTPATIPPLVFIKAEDRSELDPALDLPDNLFSESLFNTHLAVARIFRGFPFKRRLSVTTFCQEEHTAIRCVILQGDPQKISIARNPANPREWLIEFAYHTPFMTPVAGGKSILTTRIDIGFFAETEHGFSLPATLSCSFLGNEKRVYDSDGKLLSIDYRRHTFPYTDPLLSYPRHWKDEFRHDQKGRITGWTRIRNLKREPFTAYGDLAVAFDDKGRATLARRITYTPRYIGEITQENESLPSLAQVDDNIEVRYRYASDDDLIGRPDAAVTRKFTPPPEE